MDSQGHYNMFLLIIKAGVHVVVYCILFLGEAGNVHRRIGTFHEARQAGDSSDFKVWHTLLGLPCGQVALRGDILVNQNMSIR